MGRWAAGLLVSLAVAVGGGSRGGVMSELQNEEKPWPGACANDSIEIRRGGAWYHEGERISRYALVKLFSSVLRREADGSYWLVTPVERIRVKVEDAPFVVLEVQIVQEGTSQQVVSLRNNVDQWVTLGPNVTLRRAQEGEEPRYYAPFNRGLEGVINRSSYYHLVAASQLREDQLGFWSKGAFHVLGVMDGEGNLVVARS